jgi:hypothetical protein
MKWIPVTERLPKDEEVTYEVTIESMAGYRSVCMTDFSLADPTPEWKCPAYWRLSGQDQDIPFKVIAWRKAPKPYEEAKT